MYLLNTSLPKMNYRTTKDISIELCTYLRNSPVSSFVTTLQIHYILKLKLNNYLKLFKIKL